GLGKTDDYFEGMRGDLQRSRDRFTAGLRSLGFPVIESEATYFVNIDLAALGLNEDDETFCKRLVLEHKVAAIPVSAFYANDPIRSVVRFCFAKHDATLDAALERLGGALKKAAKNTAPHGEEPRVAWRLEPWRKNSVLAATSTALTN